MHVRSALPLVVAALSSGAAVAQTDERIAQDRTNRAASPSAAADYALLKDVLGAKVAFQPGAEARREAAADNESAKRPTGEVKEFLVEAQGGKVECAVVAFGGVLGLGDKTVALPVSLMTWNATDKRYELAANEDQLKSLPAFDLNEARKRGLDTEIAVIRSGWASLDLPADHSRHAHDAAGTRPPREPGATGETGRAGAGREGERGAEEGAARDRTAGQDENKIKPQGTVVNGTKFVSVPTRFVCASDIDDYAVYALNDKFGKVEECVLDRNSRKIAYCVVSHGGALGIGETEYLIPYRSLTLCRDGDAQIWCVNRTTEQLQKAVKYDKPKDGVLDPDVARRADEAIADGR